MSTEEQLKQKIMSSGKITEEELQTRIDEKLKSLGGLISEEGAIHIIANELSIPNLNPEDVVDITVTAIGTPPCGNSETATQTCNALPCPVVTFDLTDPGLICSTDDVIQSQQV